MDATTTHTGQANDFDFLHGRWRIANRRLRRRLEGCTDWDTFEALGEVQPLAGGLGNVDTFSAPDWHPGFLGLTLRLYDPRCRQWRIHWVDNANPVLQPPVVGGFDVDDGRTGLFEGTDTWAGGPVDVRFTWCRAAADEARWEQAFRADGGPWETNWTMHFRRIA